MRRALAPFSKLESSNHTQSSADSITNTSGFSFRYTQSPDSRLYASWIEFTEATAAMANLGKLFATLNQTYADSGIAHVSQIVRDLVLISLLAMRRVPTGTLSAFEI